MAVMVDRVVSELEYQLHDPQGAVKVNARAIADARGLLDQYGVQIKDLQTRMATAETTLNRFQYHMFYYLRAPGTYNETVSAFGPNNQPLPNNISVNDGAQSYVTGSHARGTGLQDLRVIFSGNVDKQTSYAIRLENKNYFGQANVSGLDNVNPAGPTTTTYNEQGLLRINYAWVQYQLSNSGVYLKGGKYNARGDIGLAYERDYFNGGLAGYKDRHWNGWIGFGQTGGPDLGSTSPFAYVPSGTASTGSVPHTQFAVVGHGGATPSDHWTFGANWAELQSYPQNIWNTVKQAFEKHSNPLAVASLAASYTFSPYALVQVEGMQRLGKDPTTNATWTDRNAIWVNSLVGKSAPGANNNFAELGFIGTGYNSVLNQETYVNATPFYTFYYTGQANDRHTFYGGIHHWLNNYTRVGVNYLNWGLNVPEPLVADPTHGVPGGSYIKQNDNRALFLNTFVQF
jgi:hypothetical protein